MTNYSEPWRLGSMCGGVEEYGPDDEGEYDSIIDTAGVCRYYVEEPFGEGDAEYDLCLRIAACINACAGITTKQLERISFKDMLDSPDGIHYTDGRLINGR